MKTLKVILPTRGTGGHNLINRNLEEAAAVLGYQKESIFLETEAEAHSPKLLRIFRYLLRIRRVLNRSESSSVVLCLGKEVYLLAYLLRIFSRRKYPLILYSMTNNSNHIASKPFPLSSIYRFFYGSLLRRADLIWSHSLAMQKDLQTFFRVPEEKLVMFYPFLADSCFERNSSGAPPVDILSVGRLAPEKNLIPLLNCLAPLLRDHGLTMAFVGDGPEYETLKNRIDELGLSSHVSLPGRLSDPTAVMANAKLLVLSSLFEGLGLVLAEAHAQGTPTVSFEIDGPAEVIVEGKNGFLVPKGNFPAFAVATKEALEKKWDHQQIQETARRFQREFVLDQMQKSSTLASLFR